MSVVAAGGRGGSGIFDLLALAGGVKLLLGREVAWDVAGGVAGVVAGGACGLGCRTEAVAVVS